MTLDDLQKLINKGEFSTLEFKRSTAQLKGAGQTLLRKLGFVKKIGHARYAKWSVK